MDGLHAELHVRQQHSGKGTPEIGRDALKPGPCHVQRHAWRKARRGEHVIALIQRLSIELQRHPDLRDAPVREARDVFRIEALAQHADHRVWIVVEQDTTPDDRRVAVEVALPETMTQEDDTPRMWTIVIEGESAALHHGRAEQGEEVDVCLRIGHLQGQPVLQVIGGRDVHATAAVGCELREHVGRLRPRGELRRRRPGIGPDQDDAIRIGVGHRPQEHGIHDGENRRARADAERQRRKGGQREAGLPSTRSQHEREILPDTIQLHVLPPARRFHVHPRDDGILNVAERMLPRASDPPPRCLMRPVSVASRARSLRRIA